jgi:hypothetical protein
MCSEEQGQGQAIHVINIGKPGMICNQFDERSHDGILRLSLFSPHYLPCSQAEAEVANLALHTNLLGLQATKAIDALLPFQ